MTPRLLDLFCGAGGAAMGYHRAGFDVVGVDIVAQPRYPFDFVQADALDVRLHGRSAWIGGVYLGAFDAVHASPPCQAFSDMKVMWNAREHPDLIEPTRELLVASGLPYVIENVPGAPLRSPTKLCGTSLGLGARGMKLRRHRLFETSWILLVPPCAHGRGVTLGVYGDHARDRRRSLSIEDGQFRAAEGLELAREAFDMPWASWRELVEAIPPAYTELIGHQLLAQLAAVAA